jgi:hypothetical protein
VIGDGGAVRLITDVLQHEQRLRAPRDDQRVGAIREVDLLEALRQADVRDREPELGEDVARLGQLSAPPVDDDERRWIGEAASSLVGRQ